MSGLPGHDIAMALLDACGIPWADARAVTFRSSMDEITTIDVTYVMRKPGDPTTFIDKHVRFQPVAEVEDGAA